MAESTAVRTSQDGATAARVGRPRIGLLGIMQELYDEMLPGITERQDGYGREVAARLEEAAGLEVVFPGPARTRAEIEERVGLFEREGLDGILIVMLTYGPALRTARALSGSRLPVMLANTQPERSITPAWDMGDMTYNQGIHGAQDMANQLVRLGRRFPVVTDDWRAERFAARVGAWAGAARAARALRGMRLAQFGQMPGMGDITTDEAAFQRTLGPQIERRSLGLIHARMQAATEEAVRAAMEADHQHFEVDPALAEEQHAYAARFQVAIEQFLEEEGYDGFSIYFGAVADDGRFEQLHMLAASNLLAKGYGYAAEGDMPCTALVAAGHLLAPDAHFTEMYAMDFERDSILQSHMGEGNWRIARKDQPVRLIDRELGIGGLGNPPTVVFQGEPGPATLVSLAPVAGEHYRLVVAQGEILESEVMPHLEMPYFHFRPETGVRSCMEGWLRQGGTHHQCLHLGDQTERWRLFAELAGLEYVRV